MEQKRSKYVQHSKVGLGLLAGVWLGVLLTVCLVLVANDHSFQTFGIEWIKAMSLLGAIVMLPPSFGILVSNRVFYSIKLSKNCSLILAAVILCLWSYTCLGFVRVFWREFSFAFVLINALLGGILANFVAGRVASKKDIEIEARDGEGRHEASGRLDIQD